MHHLTTALYLKVLDGTLPPRVLTRLLHEHLVETCAECGGEWEVSRPVVQAAARAAEPDERGPTAAVAFSAEARALEDHVRRTRVARRQARQDLWKLRRVPPARRAERIVGARTRFRTRAFAELLVEDCRERVRSEPREAVALLELVPTVLLWIPGAHEAEWAEVLAVRAAAHRANALRVAGDLPAAERGFEEARRRLAGAPLARSATYAEVASLEASLRGDQRRFEEAVELLDEAVLVYQEVGEREGLARALIQRAAMRQYRERYDEALADLDRARGLLDPKADGFLYLCTIVGTAPVLLDLGRAEEAERVLSEAEESFEAASEPWWALRLRYLLGRAALGQGDLARAEELLVDARDGFLAQELPQDVANASLDLALVYLHQGRTGEVRRLCREVAATLTALGVQRDALAALALFQKATVADAAARSLVQRLRRHLETARAANGGPGEAATAGKPGDPGEAGDRQR
jgi:tetratricopeptide (TPR) repeat protein